MAGLACPIIAIVIGEGGSGGALALGVADRILMLEYAIYSVISPEGCASILWKELGYGREGRRGHADDRRRTCWSWSIIDEIIPEPLGGAHRGIDEMAARLKTVLIDQLTALSALDLDALLGKRYDRLMAIGHVKDGK